MKEAIPQTPPKFNGHLDQSVIDSEFARNGALPPGAPGDFNTPEGVMPHDHAMQFARDMFGDKTPANGQNGGSGTGLRPVREGEFNESQWHQPENDPDHPDYLPVGTRGNEPWALDDFGQTSEPPVEEPPVEEPPVEPPVEQPPVEPPVEEPPVVDPPTEPPVEEPPVEEPPQEPSDDELEQPQGIEEIPLTAELQEALDTARDEFVRLSAKRRGISIFGYKKKLAAAKRAYDNAVNRAGQYVAEQMADRGHSPEEIQQAGAEGVILEMLQTTSRIYQRQAESANSKLLKPFYDWWARQGGKITTKEGLKGALKKAGVMGVVGFIPGVALGAVGASILGPIGIGAAVGAGIARGVGRGLMGANIDKNTGSPRVAGMQAREQFAKDEQRIREQAAEGEIIHAEDGTLGIQEHTDRDVNRNRKRMAKSAAIGAAAGAAGSIIASHLFGGSGGGSRPKARGSLTSEPRPSVPDTTPTTPDVPATPTPTGLPPLVATDGRLPWTHVTERLGNGNGTPDIFAAVEKGKTMGIDIVGRGRGLESVTWNGVTYTDNGHINAALDYIMSN